MCVWVWVYGYVCMDMGVCVCDKQTKMYFHMKQNFSFCLFQFLVNLNYKIRKMSVMFYKSRFYRKKKHFHS